MPTYLWRGSVQDWPEERKEQRLNVQGPVETVVNLSREAERRQGALAFGNPLRRFVGAENIKRKRLTSVDVRRT